MILEVARLDVRPGSEPDFEAAFAQARPLIASIPGYLGLELERCLEKPSRYVLLVRWRRLEDHTEGFRGSPQYREWKKLLHHFYDPFPTVEHFRVPGDVGGSLGGTFGTRVVRAARREDLDALIEVGRRSWLSAFARTAPFDLIAWWVREDRTRNLYEENWPEMIVLDRDGELFGLVQPKGDEINGLWVHPNWQGTGAGTLLLRAGEELIQRAGHRIARLTCSGFNPSGLDFYRRRGYVEASRHRELHASGVEVEEVRMERSLTDATGDGSH